MSRTEMTSGGMASQSQTVLAVLRNAHLARMAAPVSMARTTGVLGMAPADRVRVPKRRGEVDVLTPHRP